MNVDILRHELRKLSDSKRAKASARYFKTGRGEYGEGDQFLGIKVPEQRKVAKRYFRDITFSEIQTLLKSKVHEERFVALEMLVMKYEQESKVKNRKSKVEEIVQFYLKNAKYINNWDLVDTSASYILGHDLLDKKDRNVLYRLAKSNNMWERRIAMVATNTLIQKGQFTDTLSIATLLLDDPHDLIHKAVGWMLREVGKKNQLILETFLNQHATQMPRTMLRYAIERFPEEKRRWYLELKKI